MKPSKGKIVMVAGYLDNDPDPAIITRVLGDQPNADGTWRINVSVIADGWSSVRPLTSIPLFPDEAAAASYPTMRAYWPDRV